MTTPPQLHHDVFIHLSLDVNPLLAPGDILRGSLYRRQAGG